MDDILIVKVVLAAVMWIAGGTIIWTARAAASGRLRRNTIAGIRTPRTLADDEAWLTAHRAGRAPTEVGGWCSVASGVVALIVPGAPAVAVTALVGAAAMLTFVIIGARRGIRAVKTVEDE